MKIEEPDFIMEQSTDSASGIFDLYVLQEIKSKTNPRKEMKLVGYGIKLSSCIKHLCHYRATNKLNKDTATLNEYMTALMESKDELMKIFDEINLPKR